MAFDTYLRRYSFLGAMIVCGAILASCQRQCPPELRREGDYCVAEDAGVDAGTKREGDTAAGGGALPTGDAGNGSSGSRGDSSLAGRSTSGAGGSASIQDAVGGSGEAGSAGARADGTPSSAAAGASANGPKGGTGGGDSLASKPVCGNGKKEEGEQCDGDCPSNCEATNACLVPTLTGSAAHCDAMCAVHEITECKTGDGCCPSACKHANDDECPAHCGDGIVDPGEKCEPKSSDKPCPTSCDDHDPCTTDMLLGTAEQCTAECVHMMTTRTTPSCDDQDPCTQDSMKESATECAYECVHSTPAIRAPAFCDDGNPCTDDTQVASATSCRYECQHSSPRSRTGGNCDDGNPCTDDMRVESTISCSYDCKHSQASPGRDCGGGKMCSTSGSCDAPPPRCGDGHVDSNEKCDGNCPTSCSGGSGCMKQMLVGSADQCTAVCMPVTITTRVNNDGCCPDGEDNRTDNDCTSTIYRAGETVCQGLNGNGGNPNVAVCIGANNVKFGEAGYTDDLGTFYYRADNYKCRDSSPLCNVMLSSADTFKYIPGSGTKSGPVQLAQGERPQAAIACTCQ